MREYAMTLPRASLISVLVSILWLASTAVAQTESATVSGRVTDTDGAIVTGTEVQIESIERGTIRKVTTNDAGIYVFPGVQPGQYHMTVTKQGFRQVELAGLVVNVQDHVEKNFRLQVGSASESITVSGAAPLVNTEDASVSTVVDRRFVENMPLNGRSFQTLISLTPGVVTTPTSFSEEGQFSVNGQRADANYFMVDGVSGNIGTSSGFGLVQSIGGGLPGLSALGSTNTLVSVDAMQEFRVQTSTFAPEFGRTPGAQVSIVTRAGTNQFHGTLYDYFRNDALDSSDWFTNHLNLPKPKERQNDFGGVFGGPILRDRTFFFFSYEGLRLRQPATVTTFVPDLVARQTAPPAIQSLLNAFPLPNGPEVGGNVAQFSTSFSSPASLDSTSIRLDHLVNSKVTLFGRYDYAPSALLTRGIANALQNIQKAPAKTQTFTLGLTATISPTSSNELRINYSNARAGTSISNDDFGGAVPLTANVLSLPAGTAFTNSLFVTSFLGINGLGNLDIGRNTTNEQRQINLVDNVSWVIGTHQLKWGVDYRWLAPISSPLQYEQFITFSGLNGSTGALAGKASSLSTFAFEPTAFISRNISLYGQDTWKATSNLTVTYGLRWDVNPAVKGKNDNATPLALQNVDDPARLSVAPFGSPLYQTTFGNVATRLGVAYELNPSNHWATVFRGGVGVFYDSGSGSLGQISGAAPFESISRISNVQYPFTSAQVVPPPLSVAPPFTAPVVSADPSLIAPRTYQWNLAYEQEVGSRQTVSLTYIGAIGRDLLRQDSFFSPNPSFTSTVAITRNSGTSDYHALQIKFQRQLSQGFQALTSYTWSHSIDVASNDSGTTNTPASIGIILDRGNSDYDVRHSMSGALSYDIPAPHLPAFWRTILSGWSIDDLVIARSALPATAIGNTFSIVAGTAFAARPNLVPGVPLYIYGPQFPGGKAFNKAAFKSTVGATQGNLPRNFLRGFPAVQDDFTLRRQFRVTERVGVQFRAEFFNILNHPNFGNPVSTLTSPAFGQSTQILATALSPSSVSGGFRSLYQIGGPRSVQLAVKFAF